MSMINTKVLVSIMEKRLEEVGSSPQIEVFIHRVIADIIETALPQRTSAPALAKAKKVKGPYVAKNPRVATFPFTCQICGKQGMARNGQVKFCNAQDNKTCFRYQTSRREFNRRAAAAGKPAQYITWEQYQAAKANGVGRIQELSSLNHTPSSFEDSIVA